MTDIFISYAHEDQERVRPIVDELEKHGWSVFWDKDIPPGETWESSIGKALKESHCVLVVWSEYSQDSDWVKEEADMAKKRGALIPVLITTIEPPIGFGRIQAANLAEWNNQSSYPAFQQLVAAIDSKISLSPSPVATAKPVQKKVYRQDEAYTSGYIPPGPNPAPQPQAGGYQTLLSRIPKQQAVIAASLIAFILVVMMFMSTTEKPLPTVAGSFDVPPNFALIRGGEFTMGSPESDVNRQEYETQHQVRVSDFYMSKYAVTVGDFKKFVEATGYSTDAEKGDGSYVWDGKNWIKKSGINWRFYGDSGSVREAGEYNHPVLHVSWNDAVAYCEWMSKQTGKRFRLPTEAEWEYACRAGTTTPFNTGEKLTTDQANYNGEDVNNKNPKGVSRGGTVPVDTFSPNAWGLYNMHGNVWEWCSDWFGENYYRECKAKGTVENPVGPESGSSRVLRGGGWGNNITDCRSAKRNYRPHDYRNADVGFRVVMVP